MSKFTNALAVTPLADGKTWVILLPFSYDVTEENSNNTVEVEVGFQTDFASVPRLFWLILPRWGKYGNAAVIHDWLYWEQSRSRKEADFIMFEAMGILDVPAFKRYPIYWGIRLFGDLAWFRNKWDKQAEMNRVMELGSRDIKCIDKPDRPGLISRTFQHFFKH